MSKLLLTLATLCVGLASLPLQSCFRAAARLTRASLAAPVRSLARTGAARTRTVTRNHLVPQAATAQLTSELSLLTRTVHTTAPLQSPCSERALLEGIKAAQAEREMRVQKLIDVIMESKPYSYSSEDIRIHNQTNAYRMAAINQLIAQMKPVYAEIERRESDLFFKLFHPKK